MVLEVDGGTKRPEPKQGADMTTTEHTPVLPDPRVQPTMTVPEAGRLLGLQKVASYNAARRGDIPTISVGRRLLVPTAKLRALLGIDAVTPTDVAA
ncbi:helix-turn-helix domain-containing protein [Kitasatospora sp. NBC_01246]|uniref:helix-turn-helix domain-containing protein n=1 Tax=Kitasatospora sp. NBC_01246 TaxID=2903570 RepID=UPI002E2FB2D1|nr:helix-turn-helix domain-containing protein [Kitasatospora sp. NBC_01246]